MKAKIIAHLLGGGGINIGYHVLKKTAMLGSGFAEWEFHCADTSRNNYDNVDGLGELYQIKRKTNDLKLGVSGSGGDRRTLVQDIALNIPDYLESIGVKKKETGVYHLIVCSLSGGTGNNIGILLAEQLMKMDIPFIFMCVGDSSDDTKLRNTQSSLATLSAKAVQYKKCILVYYINNSKIKGATSLTEKVNKANESILSASVILSAFLSGENSEIDHTDMEFFISAHKLTAAEIPAGIYSVTFHTGAISKDDQAILPANAVATMARSLTAGNTPVEFDLRTRSHKVGYIVSEEAIERLSNQIPLHIISSNGALKAEVESLAEANAEALELQKSLSNYSIEAPKQAVVDDDLGMMF
jgi:hypothetical protein|nr:MAG TPA: FtsZ [Caudoviricetes sp.]